ncbi:hypothetical protein ONS95_003936 [Cadophora gregata]|uniref:uncharacterized protein n=1 Tax=Cadophora gregata TaxID=51156 RepID=UPI0026DAB0C4|nr:uncharacterized protein ONS95_003936 [Cadophora gregata]KAK0107234.1 hypothetical protein ONS95_003936 [Cadophora gregata]
MSLSHVTSAIVTMPSRNKIDSFHLFIYDFPSVFARQFPSATAKGIGIIHEWEFHFNQKNRANIRPRFGTSLLGFEPVGKEYLMPAPEVKKEIFDSRKGFPACGLIFEVNSIDNMAIERAFAKQHRQRVLCKAWTSPALGQAIDSKSVRIVTAFADLHHTRQGGNPLTFMSPAEYHRWMETLGIYTRNGMPKVLRDFVLNVVNGKATNKFSPIYINPEAYPIDVTKMIRKLKEKRERDKSHRKQLPPTATNLQKNNFTSTRTVVPTIQAKNYEARISGHCDEEHIQDQIVNVYEQPLPGKAANLQEQYYRNHGILAPACPFNDHQAKVYEDYHDEILRSQVDVDFQDTTHFKATVSYWDRISERCDDGLDVLDAIKESRSQRHWTRPNTAERLEAGEGEGETALPQPKPKPAFSVAMQKPTDATNSKTTDLTEQKPATTIINERQRPQTAQASHLAVQPPVKKQKVQQSGPSRAPKCQLNQTLASFTSTLIPTQQQRPTK